jgi:hypothetical protein
MVIMPALLVLVGSLLAAPVLLATGLAVLLAEGLHLWADALRIRKCDPHDRRGRQAVQGGS